MLFKKSKEGFSLIELSIVLVIIAIIIIGILGGKSLVRNVKIKGLIGELTNYKQALNAFYVLKDRLPGDLNLDGKIGYSSGETYTSSSYPFPYDGTDTANDHYIANYLSAPFIDLYLEKILNFEPKGDYVDLGYEGIMAKNGSIPKSHVNNDVFYYFETIVNEGTETYYNYGTKNQVFVALRFFDITKKNNFTILQEIDKKFDNGIYNTGNVRGSCEDGYTSYEDATTKCTLIFFRVW